MPRILARRAPYVAALAVLSVAAGFVVNGAGQDQSPQTPPKQFGGSYSELDTRRQKLVVDWVARFNDVTGLKLTPQAFYDERAKLSAKTTFDAVTNALMTTSLTGASGEKHGDALDLVERVESVRGQVINERGDHQFRMYVRLRNDAIDVLERSREFQRGADNTVYHKGYPINYRQQGGAPSIQISISLDRRQADVDVDYRSSGFPASLFNGHLTAANSDVRAGDNYDRHTNRWSGFQNWWRSLFGVRVGSSPDQPPPDRAGLVPATPRAGDKSVPVMMDDFLRAWLVEGDVLNAMSYISDRAYACLAQDGDEFASFDRGMAPFQLLLQLKAAHDALGKRPSLEGLVVGVRLARPELKVVTQPHHAQFVVYSVPDDVAQAFDCESRLTLADTSRARRVYGKYYGATFYIDGQRDRSMALLWARQNDFWKIVSWQSEPEGDDAADKLLPGPAAAEAPRATLKADVALVDAARDFLQAWLLRKDYGAAFKYLSPASYACYDFARGDQPAATSPADAARRIRDALERSGKDVGKQTRLDTLLQSVTPVHPAVRVLSHPYSRTFALTSVPDALATAASCDARTRGARFSGTVPLEYGAGVYGMNFRFQTRSGETPVLRMLWARENGAWRITAYAVEVP